MKTLIAPLVVAITFTIASCSDDPAPNTVFKVEGKGVIVEGQIKPGAKLTAEEAKLVVQAAIDSIE